MDVEKLYAALFVECVLQGIYKSEDGRVNFWMEHASRLYIGIADDSEICAIVRKARATLPIVRKPRKNTSVQRKELRVAAKIKDGSIAFVNGEWCRKKKARKGSGYETEHGWYPVDPDTSLMIHGVNTKLKK